MARKDMAKRLGRILPQPLLPDVAAEPNEVDDSVVVVTFPVVVVVVVEVVVVVPQSPASRVAFMLALPNKGTTGHPRDTQGAQRATWPI